MKKLLFILLFLCCDGFDNTTIVKKDDNEIIRQHPYETEFSKGSELNISEGIYNESY